jgi:hypothetical protein
MSKKKQRATLQLSLVTAEEAEKLERDKKRREEEAQARIKWHAELAKWQALDDAEREEILCTRLSAKPRFEESARNSLDALIEGFIAPAYARRLAFYGMNDGESFDALFDAHNLTDDDDPFEDDGDDADAADNS